MKIDMKHAILYIMGGGVSPPMLEIRIGEGTFSWTEKVAVEYVKNRGLLDTVRLGDQEPVEVRFDFIWEHLISHTGDDAADIGDEIPTVYEALKGIGAASTWTSSSANICEPYAVDIELVYTPPCAGDIPEKILIQDFRYEQLAADAKAGTVNVTGKANVTAPTITRSS